MRVGFRPRFDSDPDLAVAAMRLTRHQIKVIHDAAREVFGPGATVKLFGSRLDDRAKGGDIDLLVKCPRPVENAGLIVRFEDVYNRVPS